MTSPTIGIRELRSRLADQVRRAGRGESVIVTIGRRPVARLGPVAGETTTTLRDLEVAGLVRSPTVPRRSTISPVQLPVDVDPAPVLAEVRGAR